MRQISCGLQIQADQEQYHDDAKFGDLASDFAVRYQVQAIGADKYTGG
ncbi:MAG: hypothetical protein MO846_00415 [Candidatus Devosia symbiotica]|nr:hypothetical protein [Candidatus Devosia symbiotica]